MIDAYANLLNRSVWVQELALTPAETRELVTFVRWNARPENAFYHYDYFRDNCSTRVRDVIDRALRGRLRAALEATRTGTTYRWHTRRLTQGGIPIYTGMDIVLGPHGDEPLSAWEESFVPMELREHVNMVLITDSTGIPRPLVRSERMVFASTRPPEPAKPANFLPVFLIAGTILGGAIGLGARVAERGPPWTRRGLATFVVVWSAVAGFVGLVMLLSWAVTDHFFMYRNENLLQLSPLSLGLVALFPASELRGRRARLVWRLAATVLGLSILGFVLQVIPGFDQTNGEVIAFALPVHAAVAWAAYRLVSATAGARPPAAPLS